jgi:hypothetical protein
MFLFLQAGLQGHQNINRCDLCSQGSGILKAGGYDDIRITGERLSMAIDFKVWVGIIEAFSKYGLKTNSIKLTFHEFAGMCRFESKRFDSRLRKSISEALTRIRGKTITFTRSDSEGLQKFP